MKRLPRVLPALFLLAAAGAALFLTLPRHTPAVPVAQPDGVDPYHCPGCTPSTWVGNNLWVYTTGSDWWNANFPNNTNCTLTNYWTWQGWQQNRPDPWNDWPNSYAIGVRVDAYGDHHWSVQVSLYQAVGYNADGTVDWGLINFGNGTVGGPADCTVKPIVCVECPFSDTYSITAAVIRPDVNGGG